MFETNDLISNLSSLLWDSFHNSMTCRRSIQLLIRLRLRVREWRRPLCFLIFFFFFLYGEVSSYFGCRCHFSLGMVSCLLGVQ